MVKISFVNMLAAAVLFVAVGAMPPAEAADWAGTTPRATVKLADATTAVKDDSADSAVGDRDSSDDVAENASMAAAAAATAGTATEVSSGAAAPDSAANADASAAANVVGETARSSGGTSSADAAATSSSAPIFLSTGNDTCMGSSGVGVQGMEFGFSVGSSWTDENCVMLKNARELKNQGYDKAAKARLCMNDDNALAFEMAGEPCPRVLASTQAALAKMREWNPDYQAAAEPGAQFASTGAVTAAAAGVDFEDAAGPADTDTEWLSPKIDGFLAMISSVMTHMSSVDSSVGLDDVTAMDGLE